MRNLSELSRLARLAEVWLGTREPDQVELELPIELPDLESSQKEIVWRYWRAIEALKINYESFALQDALNGHPHHLEDAFLCLLEQKDNLKYPTRFLIKALQSGWKPNRFKSFEEAKKVIPWL